MMKSVKGCFFLILIVSLLFSDCSGGQVPEFDGSRAYADLEKQCAFGPRCPGSAGHQTCLDFLFESLQQTTDMVVKQTFPFSSPLDGKPYRLTNLIASYGSQGDRVLLCAHWDTRPIADQDPDPSKRNTPILGANDGASGVSVLLELARLFKESPPPVGVDIVLFDGEDSGQEGKIETWCQGSRYFAKNKRTDYLPRYGILLDMIGDADLHVFVEGFSRQYVPDLVEWIWNRAELLGLPGFDRTVGYEMIDDHLELIKAGIPTANLIDFDYPYWHTTEDTPDKCSPESLKTIGTLLAHLIYE